MTYAVPVMLAVLVAKTVADALEPKGIYDLVIEYFVFLIVLLVPKTDWFLDSLNSLTWMRNMSTSGVHSK